MGNVYVERLRQFGKKSCIYLVEAKILVLPATFWEIYTYVCSGGQILEKMQKRLRHFEKFFRIYALRGDTFLKKSVCT
jgi:hypothetical protein